MTTAQAYRTGPLLHLATHPFFVGPVPPTCPGEYRSFPFSLGIHPKYALPVQIVTEEVGRALEKAYALGSMLSTPLGHSPLSRARLDEVLSLLLARFGGGVRGAAFLEIGCGSGDLLNELKLRGADVMGIEIGPQGREGARKYGFPVIAEPFAPGLVNRKFDCVFSYGCLEHVLDLEKIFIASRECLKNGGLFFHAVPNSGQFFKQATFDNLYHEHINYFSAGNGTRLFEAQGFLRAQGYSTPVGNELYLWGYFDEQAALGWPGDDRRCRDEESDTLTRHMRLLAEKTERVTAALRHLLSSGGSLGLYAGGFEYGVLLGNNAAIRYFDGDTYKHGMAWLPGLPLIESPVALRTDPVDHIIICKSHFFHAIADMLTHDVAIRKSSTLHDLGNL